ncbi:fumble-domain-containing protein [Catenaria anguillulae PL171]|uniref:pantothenate kinase n=1 Tax=Catenaria anguillulae PL171 TaxID=765915 RepID=A0A1Y2HCL0_9FUNG|nr:fumble-domain-containing protein [Catenaria anguillulae PL171]
MMNLAGVHLGDEVSLRGIRDIVFPEHNDHVPQIAIDIGGSLVKIAYFTRHASTIATTGSSPNASISLSQTPAAALAASTSPSGSSPSRSSQQRATYVSPTPHTPTSSSAGPSTIASAAALAAHVSPFPSSDGRGSPAGGSGGRLNFVKFETAKMPECIAFLKQLIEEQELDADVPHERTLLATGGGAYKYYETLERELGAKIFKYDEMECLVKGLVNIGSGVSILKVTAPGVSERISGTSLGGGTYWGLMSMLAVQHGVNLTFDDMLELSKTGDNTNVDMLVGDIYGMDYNKIGLKSTTIASTFGKMFKKSPDERQSTPLNDMSRSLLFMLSNNIGQIAHLNAKAHNISRIYFGGYFICGHPITMHTLSYAIQFWSRGETKALFLRHEGFLGAVGAFLQHQ